MTCDLMISMALSERIRQKYPQQIEGSGKKKKAGKNSKAVLYPAACMCPEVSYPGKDPVCDDRKNENTGIPEDRHSDGDIHDRVVGCCAFDPDEKKGTDSQAEGDSG
ncbi:MAG TPA: hypothetical protein VIV61_05870 [Candidatus Ozemobacteraceae bacterium]